jgi:hypothetical protein
MIQEMIDFSVPVGVKCQNLAFNFKNNDSNPAQSN